MNPLQKLEEKRLIIQWLINGMFIHCVPIKYASILTKEKICETWNTDMSYFKSIDDFKDSFLTLKTEI